MRRFPVADQERPAGQEVRALPLQLPPDMQELVPEDRLPQAELQAHNQPGAESGHSARGHRAGNVQGDLRALPRHISGELGRMCEERVFKWNAGGRRFV